MPATRRSGGAVAPVRYRTDPALRQAKMQVYWAHLVHVHVARRRLHGQFRDEMRRQETMNGTDLATPRACIDVQVQLHV